MTEEAMKLDIAIYLRGDELEPSSVTTLLGVQPTRAQYKGQKSVTSTNREVIAKTGMWVLAATTTSADLSELISELAEKVGAKGSSLKEIAGVQDAYVDVFIAVDAEEDGGGNCEFQLASQDIVTLETLGLPIRFSVAVVNP